MREVSFRPAPAHRLRQRTSGRAARTRRLHPRRRARDDRGLDAACGSASPDGRRVVLSRSPRQRQSGVRRRPDGRVGGRRLERAGSLHLEPARAGERTAGGAADRRRPRGPVDLDAVVRARRPGGRRRAICSRPARRPDHPGDHERHAARGVGSLAARVDGARHGDQRRHPRIRRPHHFSAGIVQGSVRGGGTLRAARRPRRTRGRPGTTHGAAEATLTIRDARRVRAHQLRRQGVADRQRRRPGCAREPADAAAGDAARRLRGPRDPGDQRRADVRSARARQLRRAASSGSGACPPFLAPPLRSRVRSHANRAAQADGGLVG